MGCISSQPETTIYKLLERLSLKIQNHRHSDESLEVEIRESYQEIIRIVKKEQKVMFNIEIEIERFSVYLKIQRPDLYYRVEKDSYAISSFMQVYNYGTARFNKHHQYEENHHTTVPNFESTPLKVPRKVYQHETTMASITCSSRGGHKTRRDSPPPEYSPEYPTDDIESCPCERVKVTRDMRNSGSTDQGDAYPNIRLKRMFYACESNESQETIGDFGFYDETLGQ